MKNTQIAYLLEESGKRSLCYYCMSFEQKKEKSQNREALLWSWMVLVDGLSNRIGKLKRKKKERVMNDHMHHSHRVGAPPLPNDKPF